MDESCLLTLFQLIISSAVQILCTFCRYLQLCTPNIQLGIKQMGGRRWKLPVGGKQWWRGDAATLTRDSAAPFFPASDSSRSVNCSDTQHHLSLTPKPHSLLAASWAKRHCQQHFQPLLTLNPYSSLLCSSLVAPKTPILKMKRLLEKQLCCDILLMKNPLFTWAVIGMSFVFTLGMRKWDVKCTELWSRLLVIWNHWHSASPWRGTR